MSSTMCEESNALPKKKSRRNRQKKNWHVNDLIRQNIKINGQMTFDSTIRMEIRASKKKTPTNMS